MVKKHTLLLLFLITSFLLYSIERPLTGKTLSFALVIFSQGSLIFALVILLRRLRDVIKLGKAATSGDLLFTISLYAYTILAFGFLYHVCQNLFEESLFKGSEGLIRIDLLNAFYFSGVTIATVGYGDFTPAHPLTKVAAIAESTLGLGLTAIVVGFFIGSLLGRQQQQRETRWFREFVTPYIETVIKYRDAVLSGDELNRETIIRLRQDLLRTVASLVRQYTLSSGQITVNWMQLFNRSDAPSSLIELTNEFVPPAIRDASAEGTFGGILVIREWGDKPHEMPDKGEFALPVYDPGSPFQLPGAPLAVINESGYDVISDAQNIDLRDHDQSVVQKLNKYFRDHAIELQSFASIRMALAGEVLGVINFQSNQTELCGSNTDDQRVIIEMIKPFAQHLADMIYLEATMATEGATPLEVTMNSDEVMDEDKDK